MTRQTASTVHYRYGSCHYGRAQATARLANSLDDVTCRTCLRMADARELARATHCTVAADLDPHDVERVPLY